MKNSSERLSIARVTTVPMAFTHLKGYLNHLENQGDQVTLITSKGELQRFSSDALSRSAKRIDIYRKINLIKDFKALIQLIIILRKNQYQVAHSTTPKAGLLLSLAGLFVSKTIIIHTFTGQRWNTMKGLTRTFFKLIDKLIILLNDQCYVDSFYQLDLFSSEGIASKDDLKCIGKGSNGGINIDRFDNKQHLAYRESIRGELGIPLGAMVFVFSGRINKDKGINELVVAFKKLQNDDANIHLVLLGPVEDFDNPIKEKVRLEIKNNRNIHTLGFIKNPEHYYAASDIFCLPSYREGLPISLLEAASSGLAIIGSKIPSILEIITAGENGLVCEVENIDSLYKQMKELLIKPELKDKISKNIRQYVVSNFDQKEWFKLQTKEYQSFIKS